MNDEKSNDLKAQEENTEVTEQTPAKKKIGWKKVVLIVVCTILFCVVCIVGVAAAIFMHYYSLMDTVSDNSNSASDYYVSYSDDMEYTVDSPIELPEDDIYVDKDVENILLIGTDERTAKFNYKARADSMIILSLNHKTGNIKLVSLERGMSVRIPGRADDLLTHTFRYGGADLLLKTIRTHFRVDVDKYVRINFNTFETMINAAGGVDITLSEKEAYGLNTYPNGNTWKLDRVVSAGENHFNGFEALQYSRMRWIDSDWRRVERQRKVIIALKDKCSEMSLGELNEFAESCLPLVQTNISSTEMAGLLISLPNFLDADLQQMTIPKKGTYQGLGDVDFNANTKILHEFLYE